METKVIIDKDLFEFLKTEIPETKFKKKGFMDITGIQYHENSISQIYAYFFEFYNNKAISNLFTNSLIELIKLKSNCEIELYEPTCSLEQHTLKGNRIDLVIYSSEKSQKKSAIIIENKIFHKVQNDLKDYYDSVESENKIGILLTLKKEKINKELNGIFYNITHDELINQIKSMGLPNEIETNEYVYLNDFINNMDNLTSKININDEAKFFFENSSKVLRAKKTYDAAYEYVISQLKILAEKLNFNFYGNSFGWRHIWDSKNESQVYYAIILDNILSSKPNITIYLEVYKDAIKFKDDFRKILSDNNCYVNLNDDKKSNSTWAHLAYKTYELDLEIISNLSDFLLDKINIDFCPAYDLVSKQIECQK